MLSVTLTYISILSFVALASKESQELHSSFKPSSSLPFSSIQKIREESRRSHIFSFCRKDFNDQRDLCNKSIQSDGLLKSRDDMEEGDDSYRELNCYCDDRCHVFGDCCIDKALRYKGPPFRVWTCVDVPIREQGVYVLQECHPNWLVRKHGSMSSQIAKMCLGNVESFLQWVPVYSRKTKILYRNVFCAICNYDNDALQEWNITISCDQKLPQSVIKPNLIESNFNVSSRLWEFPFNGSKHVCQPSVSELESNDSRVKFNTRHCRFPISGCASDWDEGVDNEHHLIAERCSFYTFMVYVGKKYFKNLYCAKCNHLSKDEMRRVGCDLEDAVPIFRSSKIDEMTSMAILFSLNSQPACNLEDGYLFDPVSYECLTLQCGPSYHLNTKLLRCENTEVYRNGTVSKSLDCMRIFINQSDYAIVINGKISLHDSNQLLDEDSYEPYFYYDVHKKVKMTGILICYDKNHRFAAPFLYDHYQGLLSFVTLTISIVGLIAYLGVFLSVPKLRNLRAMMVMSLSTALLFASVAFVCGVLSRPHLDADIIRNERGSLFCVITAVSIHYFYLVAFAWMNVMAYDAWKSFKRTHERLSNSMIHFLKYSLYSWLTPAIIVLIACAFDLSNIRSEYQPLYGHRVCWISQKKALLAFFVLPVSVIILSNIGFFSWTAFALIRTNRQTKFASNSKQIKDSSRRQFILYVRLATIMGLTWIFGTVAALTSLSFLWYPFIILNGLQGAFIFFYFACKSDVYRLLRERMELIVHGHEVVSTSSAAKTRSSSLIPTNSSLIVSKY